MRACRPDRGADGTALFLAESCEAFSAVSRALGRYDRGTRRAAASWTSRCSCRPDTRHHRPLPLVDGEVEVLIASVRVGLDRPKDGIARRRIVADDDLLVRKPRIGAALRNDAAAIVESSLDLLLHDLRIQLLSPASSPLRGSGAPDARSRHRRSGRCPSRCRWRSCAAGRPAERRRPREPGCGRARQSSRCEPSPPYRPLLRRQA